MSKSIFFKSVSMLICFSMLTACIGLGGLSHRQIKVLQKEGFVHTAEGWALDMPSRLLFNTDQYTLRTEQQAAIEDLSQKLLAINIHKLIVQGHTDSVGNDAYNLELSHKRANSVAEVLLNQGFNPSSIQVTSYGSQKPVSDNTTVQGRQENRRVSILIAP